MPFAQEPTLFHCFFARLYPFWTANDRDGMFYHRYDDRRFSRLMVPKEFWTIPANASMAPRSGPKRCTAIRCAHLIAMWARPARGVGEA